MCELTVPDGFRQTALAFPSQVKQALAAIESQDDAVDMLDKAEAMSQYARRVREDTETINAIQYGKLLIVAALGGMLPSEQGKRSDLTSSSGQTKFAKATSALYRKIAEHEPRIDEYRDKVEGHNAEQGKDDPDIVEVSTAGFIRYIGADGNLKTNQNKGVIEWYTPQEYVEAARKSMGSIDLDPASNDMANEKVQAKTYYTKEDSGLDHEWHGNVFMNPPFATALIKQFIGKLCHHLENEDVQQAVLLTNNSTDTQWWHQAANACSAICFTEGRVSFYSPVGEIATPTNGHTFFYFGDRKDAFCREFDNVGIIAGFTDA